MPAIAFARSPSLASQLLQIFIATLKLQEHGLPAIAFVRSPSLASQRLQIFIATLKL